MPKNLETTALPKLRFPEFQGEGAWEIVHLGKILNITSSKRVHESEWTTEGVPFYRTRELVALNANEPINPLSISKDLYKRNTHVSGEIKAGDILVTGVGTIGIPYLVKKYDKFYFKDGNIIWLQNNEAKVIGQYLYWIYESDYIKSQIKKISGTGTVGTYTIDNAKKTVIPLPSRSEQQKIADTLSSLDDLIATETTRLQTYQAHKKGLMQALFPAEGETVPQVRFPEFKGDGEWQEKELGKLGELVSGLTYSPKDVRESGLLVLRSSNIQNGAIDLNDCVYVRDDISGAKLSMPNDILICVRNGSKSLIGKNALIPKKMPTCTHGAFMTAFRSKYAKFIYQLFQTERYIDQVSADLGATINSINGNLLRRYKFFLPHLPEQQKIVDTLSSLDDLITAQAQKIEALRQQKKGLMQGLFPISA